MKARIRQNTGQRSLGRVAGNHNEGSKQLRFRLFWTVILVFGLGGLKSAAQSTPNFGPNVIIIDPSMPSSTINSTLASVAALDVNSQFITSRYAVLFKPGTYSVQAPIGYYESIAGLGTDPSAVTINGFITPNFGSVPENQNL